MAMLTIPERRRIQLDEIQTAYVDIGQGETIVALHGIPTSSLLFAPLMPHLRDVRVIAPDLLGQGLTEVPATGRLNFSAYAMHLRQFLDQVPPRQFHLLVHDLGGVLGLDWATENPERIKSLIILSTTITGTFRVGKALYAANLLFGRNLLRWGMQSTLKRPQKLHPALMSEWIRPWSRRRILRGMDHFAPHHLRRIRETLGSIRAPVLAIWGEQDGIFPIQHSAHFARTFPHARIVALPQCGHWSTLDAPAEVGQAMQTFLRSPGA